MAKMPYKCPCASNFGHTEQQTHANWLITIRDLTIKFANASR